MPDPVLVSGEVGGETRGKLLGKEIQ